MGRVVVGNCVHYFFVLLIKVKRNNVNKSPVKMFLLAWQVSLLLERVSWMLPVMWTNV